jgi:hypothetical protein
MLVQWKDELELTFNNHRSRARRRVAAPARLPHPARVLIAYSRGPGEI